MTAKGYLYSYDMLGEAARTEADALRYFKAYQNAIAALAKHSTGEDIRFNPGISVKLSALHPRYEQAQKEAMLPVMAERLLALALAARDARMGLNIDAEEADRLDLSLDVIERVLADAGARRLERLRRGGAGLRSAQRPSSSTGCMRWRRSSTARSWCGWSRAPIGIPRSSARRRSGSSAIRSSRARRTRTFPTSPARESCCR